MFRPWQKSRTKYVKSGVRRVAFASMCLVLIAIMLIVGSGLISSPPPVGTGTVNASLSAPKKIYGNGEHPVLSLALRPQSTALGSWLVPHAWAESTPQVSIDNEGRRADVSSTIKQTATGYDITLAPKGFVRPGSYTVSVTGESGGQAFKTTQSFAWGVLAINTNKAAYQPGEAVLLQMAALSSSGHTLCSAPLQLTITDPAGVATSPEYNVSDQCKGDSFSSVPDYTAGYQTGGPGRYDVSLGIKDTPYVVHDSFTVAEPAAFDVERSGVTRLYPSSTYGMSFIVKPQVAYKGTVTETLPSEFSEVKADGAGAIATAGNRTSISWQVDWKQGGSYNLGYTYQPPHITPAFFTLGPLKIGSLYTEGRAWQQANDAAITLVKQTTVNVTTAANTNTSSVTSTAGNTLVMLFSKNGTATGTVPTISDSAGNTWVAPSTNPSQGPPANFVSGTVTGIAMAYIANASAITTVTVGVATSTTYGYTVMELSGADNLAPVDQSASNANATSSTSITTPTATVTTCDAPTTDQLLRGGDYFCSPDNQIIIAMAASGANSMTLNTAGFTATAPLISYPTSISTYGAYRIVSATGQYSVNWTSSISRAATTAIMSFRQGHSASDEKSFFWAN